MLRSLLPAILALASANAGAELVTTEMVGYEWMRSARHPRFRDFVPLVK